GEAANALLRDAGLVVVHHLLVRAGGHALLVSPAAGLVHQDNAVLRSLVDRLPRAGRDAGGIGAVVADAGQVGEPGVVGEAVDVRPPFDGARRLVLAHVRVGPVLRH